MKLQLHHTGKIQHKACAALIRGASADIWLKEISSWGADVSTLQCYIIPLSIADVTATGLFVVFSDVSVDALPNLLDAYGMVGGKLYLPVNALPYPTVSDAELSKLLLWHIQVFHPTIGLIGFEEKDRLQLSDLVQPEAPVAKAWNKAHPGIAPRAVLHSIKILQPTPEEILESVRKELDTKPLDEIPGFKDDNKSAADKLADNIKYGLSKTAHGILTGMGNVLGGGNNSGGSGKVSPGMLQQLMDWLEKNMDVIEKKRRDELQRLLDLFDEDSAEALKYALPLDSPYLDRGKAPPSSQLGRRDVNFNLRNLGGGGGRDAWDVGDYYGGLRTKYLRAAQAEVDRKEFKKAAYIYAHLLNDYHAAANVLVKGGFYREAAILYKDHLHNIASAAECLEKGGLLLEAIELYDGLQKTEKIGDLYKQLGEEEKAGIYFEKTVGKAIERRDYLDASRILKDKMLQTERAKDALLAGWNDYGQPEACLKNYYELTAATGDEKLAADIQYVYTQRTPSAKRVHFLNVIAQVSQQNSGDQTTGVSREIAFDIISAETKAGNLSIAHQLKTFFPEDKLIASDSSRFVNSGKRILLPAAKSNNAIHLEKDIQWITGVTHRNQFLVLGLKNNSLHLARGNWYGYVGYYSWTRHFEKNDRFNLVVSPYNSGTVIIQTTAKFYLDDKELPKNKHFDEALFVTQPAWLPKEYAGICYNGDGALTVLKTDRDLTLYHYKPNGQLDKWFDCVTDGPSPYRLSNAFIPPPFIFHNQCYYTYRDRFFVSFSYTGKYNCQDMGTGIRLMGVSHFSSNFTFVLSTNKGCIICGMEGIHIGWRSSYFATDAIPSSITFIAAEKFVIVQKNMVTVYQLVDAQVKELNAVAASSLIISILKGNNRKQFSILEDAGVITHHDIEVNV